MERQHLLGDGGGGGGGRSERSPAGVATPKGGVAAPKSGIVVSKRGVATSRGGLIGALGDLFAGRRAKSNSSLVCEAIVVATLVMCCLSWLRGVEASPVVSEKQLSTYHLIPSARNIRHLPCVSRRTREEGVCMFAIDCLKANGTHLGTCIDRFYFGSCCQIRDYEINQIEDNSINEEKPSKEGDDNDVVAVTSSIRPKLPSSAAAGTTHYITKKPSAASSTATVTRKPETKLTTTAHRYSTTTTTTRRTPTPPIDRTEEKYTPSSKPSRHNATTAGRPSSPTSSSLSSSYHTTTEDPTRFTTGTVQTTIYINNQLYNASKPVETTRRPAATTELPQKLTTFQSVSVQKTTQKPSTVNSYGTTYKRPSQKPESTLPFGTRLPSTPPQPSTTTSGHSATTPSPLSSTIGQVSTTNAPLNSSPQKPIRPTVSQNIKPERPTPKPTVLTTKQTPRPSVQRPINSTLSNRRPTTNKPTQTETTTKKTTTIVYKPFTSLKPANTSQQAFKPTKGQTSTKRPTTVSNKPSSAPTKVTGTTTTTLAANTTKVIASTTRRPVTNATKGSSSTTISAKPTRPVSSESTKPPTATTAGEPLKINYTTGVYHTQSSTKPTRQPVRSPTTTVGGNATLESTRTTTTTPKSRLTSTTTTPSPLTNEVDATLRPTADDRTTTTEKIGLVTWTSITEQASAGNGTAAAATEEWKPTTPTWILLSTLSPNNDVATMQPSQTIQPSKKPVNGTARPETSASTSSSALPSSPSSSSPSSSSPSSPSSPTSPSSTYTPSSPDSTSSTASLPSTVSSPSSPDSTSSLPSSPSSPSSPDSTSSLPLSPSSPSSPDSTSSFPTSPSSPSSPSSSSSTTSSGSTATTPKPTPTESGLKENVTSASTASSSSTDSSSSSTQVDSTTFASMDYDINAVGPTDDGNETLSSANATTVVEGIYGVTTDAVGISTANTTDDALSTEKSTVSPIEVITSTGMPSGDAVNMSDYTDVCGRRLWPEARIVGGARSSFGRWPWQISLRQWRTSTYLHKCGAALLNENWAITAAHCVDSVPPSDLLLRLGEHDLASEDEPYGFQERRVQIVASHPQFDPRTFEYDLALLRFYEPVTFQPNILPVCVPTDDEGFIGKTAYVTGWGRLYEDGPLPSVLQEVSVPVIENAICENMYRNAGYIEHIPKIFICAGWKKGGFDSCEGDSGGPMVLQRPDKRFLLAGVISWGIGCAEPNQPGVYTRISQFRHWINQILQF